MDTFAKENVDIFTHIIILLFKIRNTAVDLYMIISMDMSMNEWRAPPLSVWPDWFTMFYQAIPNIIKPCYIGFSSHLPSFILGTSILWCKAKATAEDERTRRADSIRQNYDAETLSTDTVFPRKTGLPSRSFENMTQMLNLQLPRIMFDIIVIGIIIVSIFSTLVIFIHRPIINSMLFFFVGTETIFQTPKTVLSLQQQQLSSDQNPCDIPSIILAR